MVEQMSPYLATKNGCAIIKKILMKDFFLFNFLSAEQLKKFFNKSLSEYDKLIFKDKVFFKFEDYIIF